MIGVTTFRSQQEIDADKESTKNNHVQDEYEFRFNVSFLLRKNIREIMEIERFYGRDINWLEFKGLYSSVFIVKGPVVDSKALENRIELYLGDNGEK